MLAAELSVATAPVVRKLGCVGYAQALAGMRQFTSQRNDETPDELWLLEHPPVYTLGQGANAAHGPRKANGIEVVRVERGGEVTYHGPGQLVCYTLIDLARREIKVRDFVRRLEQSLIDLLTSYSVEAVRKPGAPGVYVGGAKIAALGIRVARGRTLHGLSLNVDMDLTPFGAIDPCGYPGLAITQTRDLGIAAGLAELGDALASRIASYLEAPHA
jgi:lipoyl(octanoyl) transferase